MRMSLASTWLCLTAAVVCGQAAVAREPAVAVPRSDGALLALSFDDPSDTDGWQVPNPDDNLGDTAVRNGRLLFATGQGDNLIERRLEGNDRAETVTELDFGLLGPAGEHYGVLGLRTAKAAAGVSVSGDLDDAVALTLQVGPRSLDLGLFKKDAVNTLVLHQRPDGILAAYVRPAGGPARLAGTIPFDKAPLERVTLGNGVGRTAGSLFVERLSMGAAVRQARPAAELLLKPANTVIVHPGVIRNDERLAAALLQKWLRRSCGADSGFEVVAEDALHPADARHVLSVGATRWARNVAAGQLDPHGFLLRRVGDNVVIKGGAPRGTCNGAVRFLDRFAGVRFYMPGDLFTSVTRQAAVTVGPLDLTDEPYIKSAYASSLNSDPARELAWVRANAMLRRQGGTHQHSVFERFPPETYARTMPEIYPIIDGRRYIPTSPRDQRWQPCFSEPRLVDAAVQSATEYFETRPDDRYISFSIMDGHQFCECDRCTALRAEHGEPTKDPRGRSQDPKGQSFIYWTFLNQVAHRLETLFPQKRVVGLSYSQVRMPPPFELHENIVVWQVWKMSDIVIDRRFDVDAKPLPPNTRATLDWSKVAHHTAHHDWAQGAGFLIPRVYSKLVKRSFLEMQRLGMPIEYTHLETYPSWGMDGPKYYLIGRIWWNPQVDVDALVEQFARDLFGEAARPMHEYFMLLETLYGSLNQMQERKIGRYRTQFLTRPEHREMIARCRTRLDRAASVARDDPVRQRIELFSKTFRLSEFFFTAVAEGQLTDPQARTIRDYARRVIAPDPLTVYRRVRPGTTHEAVVMKQIDSAIGQVQQALKRAAQP